MPVGMHVPVRSYIRNKIKRIRYFRFRPYKARVAGSSPVPPTKAKTGGYGRNRSPLPFKIACCIPLCIPSERDIGPFHRIGINRIHAGQNERRKGLQVNPTGRADPLLPFPIALPLEDSTRFCRKVLGGALTNRFTMSGKQILEAVEEAAGLLELSRS